MLVAIVGCCGVNSSLEVEQSLKMIWGRVAIYFAWNLLFESLFLHLFQFSIASTSPSYINTTVFLKIIEIFFILNQRRHIVPERE